MAEQDILPPDIEDPLFAPFWQGTREGRLMVQACDDCATPRWPPRRICPACGSFATRWVECAPRGTLFSWTVIGKATAKGFTEVPYVVGLITLDDTPGVRLVGNVIGLAPEALRVGLPLRGRFVDAGAMTLLRWEAG
jgi:uncharacterized OB-fold protein